MHVTDYTVTIIILTIQLFASNFFLFSRKIVKGIYGRPNYVNRYMERTKRTKTSMFMMSLLSSFRPSDPYMHSGFSSFSQQD